MIFYYVPAILIIAAIAVWLFRYARSVRRGDYRHAKGAKQVWWIPGGGGHGGGGSVPPIISSGPED
jgi:hypothetical protein